MAKINFYLKGVPSPEALENILKSDRVRYLELIHQLRPIICSISFDGRREIISTQIFMSLQFWEVKKQEVKSGKDAPTNRKKINDSLAEKRRIEYDVIENAQIQELYIERMQLSSIFRDEKLDENLETIEAIFKKFKSEHRTNDGFSIKHRTAQKYITLMNHVIAFQTDDKFIPKRITNEWVDKFKKFLLNRELNDNSVAKYITGLKTLKKYLLTIGIKLPAQLEDVKVVERDQIVNILEMRELEILEQFQFESIFHSQVRDVFLFQC